MCFAKKSIIFGVLAGLLSIGSVACQKPAIQKLPLTSPLRKAGMDKDAVDTAKTAIDQVEKIAGNMRDASMKEAVNAITNALRAVDSKVNRVRKRTMKKRRKKHMGKAAGQKEARKTPAERQAARAARKEARAAK